MFKFSILELLYPNVCGICGKMDKESLCKKCEIKLKKLKINANLTISEGKKYFDYGIGIYKYEDIIRKKIIEYKFEDKPYLYKTFAKMILKNEKICGILKKYDIIIPVPIHKKRKYKRGYNQTELIAKEISKNIRIMVLNKILIKNKNITSQALLNRTKRRENIKDAFVLKNHEILKGKNVVLFDDIYTTGSTVNECSKLLKKAKVKSIEILTIAKD